MIVEVVWLRIVSIVVVWSVIEGRVAGVADERLRIVLSGAELLRGPVGFAIGSREIRIGIRISADVAIRIPDMASVAEENPFSNRFTGRTTDLLNAP
jgi:hypothetical protein